MTPEDALRPPLAPEWLREGRGWRISQQPRGEDAREDREGAEAWRQVWESPGEPAPPARAGLLMPTAPERPQPPAFVSKALTSRGSERTHERRCTRFLPPPPKLTQTRGTPSLPRGTQSLPLCDGRAKEAQRLFDLFRATQRKAGGPDSNPSREPRVCAPVGGDPSVKHRLTHQPGQAWGQLPSGTRENGSDQT